jgi:hypothetical protein
LIAGSFNTKRKITGLQKSRTSTGGGCTSGMKLLATATGYTSTLSTLRKHWRKFLQPRN